jgi:hypothetical protein
VAPLPAVVVERTFEAVVVDWDGTAVPDRAVEVAAVRARVEALCAAGVHVVVVSDRHVRSVDGRLAARPVGPGRLHMCLDRGSAVYEITGDGPMLAWRRTATPDERGPGGASSSIAWIAAWLAHRGITGGLILVVGDRLGAPGGTAGGDSGVLAAELARAVAVSVGAEPGGCVAGVVRVGGGWTRLLEIFDGQLARRRDHRVPSVDADPAWLVRLPSDPQAQRMAEALGALANGWAGVRAAREERGPVALPLFAVNGRYTDGEAPELLAGPQWDQLAFTATDGDTPSPAEPAGTERMIDLRTGVLVRPEATGLHTFRFVSAARREALALRAEAPATRLLPGPALAKPDDAPTFEGRRRHGADLARVRSPGDGGIAMASRDRDRVVGGRRVVERLAAWTVASSRAPTWSGASEALDELEGAGEAERGLGSPGSRPATAAT